MAITGKVMAAAFFSNSYARGKYGSMKFNAATIPKFATSVNVQVNLDVYFYGPVDGLYAVIK